MKAFSELTAREKLVELLRWIGVPIVAVLSVVLLRFVIALLRPPALAQLPGAPETPLTDLSRLILPRLFGALLAALFVLAGARTAPRCRVATAGVLAAFWTTAEFLSHVVLSRGRGVPHYADVVIAAIAAGGAVVYLIRSTRPPRA